MAEQSLSSNLNEDELELGQNDITQLKNLSKHYSESEPPAYVDAYIPFLHEYIIPKQVSIRPIDMTNLTMPVQFYMQLGILETSIVPSISLPLARFASFNRLFFVIVSEF